MNEVKVFVIAMLLVTWWIVLALVLSKMFGWPDVRTFAVVVATSCAIHIVRQELA